VDVKGKRGRAAEMIRGKSRIGCCPSSLPSDIQYLVVPNPRAGRIAGGRGEESLSSRVKKNPRQNPDAIR